MVPISSNLDEIYASDKNLKREDVKILQEWMKKQPHLPEVADIYIIIFLHSCYYSVEQTKTTIDAYCTYRTHYDHILHRLNEEELRRVSSFTLISMLPKKTPKGNAILFGKLIDFRPENFLFGDIIKLIEMTSVLYLSQNCPINGAVVVFDATGFSLSHLTKFNIVTLKHSFDYLQEGAPVRLKEIHLINAVPILDKVLALIKPLMKGELFKLISVHSNFDTFYKYVPRDLLPEDYGGDASPCQILQEKNLEQLLSYSEFFAWNDSLRVDESKRLEKSNSFGIEGTFKKLEID